MELAFYQRDMMRWFATVNTAGGPSSGHGKAGPSSELDRAGPSSGHGRAGPSSGHGRADPSSEYPSWWH